MAIKYPDILSVSSRTVDIDWSDRDIMLYALGLGYGADPLVEAELPFVFERQLRIVPTMATVAAFATHFPFDQTGINLDHALHGEESLEVRRPLIPGMRLRAKTRVASVQDKGAGRGALIGMETVIEERDSGDTAAICRSTTFGRAEGGFGGPTEGGAPPCPIPDREPDLIVDAPTRPDQALTYRLSGDRNPIHADPVLAKQVGFPRPILHGLCTYGIACKVVLEHFAQNDPARVRGHRVRFSSPVLPGDTLRFRLWQDGDAISWTAGVAGRDGVALNNGQTLLG